MQAVAEAAAALVDQLPSLDVIANPERRPVKMMETDETTERLHFVSELVERAEMQNLARDVEVSRNVIVPQKKQPEPRLLWNEKPSTCPSTCLLLCSDCSPWLRGRTWLLTPLCVSLLSEVAR